MNELQIIVNENQEQTVSGRGLHMFLEIKTPYTMWLERMCEYGFTEGVDFITKLLESNGGRQGTDHVLKLDMAKELCMLARNDKGKQARHYFLEVEREWNSPEKVMARALLLANKKLVEKSKQLEATTAKLEEAKPKIVFADAVSASDATILIGDLAKLIKQNGYAIGQKRLFEWLRNNGYLIKRAGADYNSPTQKAMEMGLLKLKESAITHPDGHVIVSKTPKVTGKGQAYFINKLLKLQIGGNNESIT